MASDWLREKDVTSSFDRAKRERETVKEGGVSPKNLPRGPFGWRVPRENGKDDSSLWHPRVLSELTWATGSGENSWWMEGGRMAKGLCPGVVWSRGKESVEKKARERERYQYSSGYVENQ